MAHDLSRPDPDDAPPEARAARGIRFPLWNLLLLVPLIGTLVPGWYNRREPLLWDIPFFYWYQMAFIFVSVLITYVVYRATRGER